MPRGDGTGPAGSGAMTGRRAGYCAGYGVPGFMNTAVFGGMGLGRGMGRGFGRGMGWGRGMTCPAPGVAYPAPFAVPATPQDEAAALREQANRLNASLDGINRRLAELGNAGK